MSALLEIRDLTVGYGWRFPPAVTAVRDVSLTVNAVDGERFEVAAADAVPPGLWLSQPAELYTPPDRYYGRRSERFRSSGESRSRRQQVMPEPQPSSCGSISQGIPLRRTNRIPVRQARSGKRGLPPLGLHGEGGNSG